MTQRAGLPAGAVLVVDDDPRWLFSVRAYLSKSLPSWSVLTAQTGPDGLSLLRQVSDIRLVLLDLLMPDMSGFDVLKAWKRMAPRDTTPFVAVTTDVFPETRQACLEAGFVDYVPKPLETDELDGLVARWLPIPIRT